MMEVFFTNGNRAKFHDGKVAFTDKPVSSDNVVHNNGSVDQFFEDGGAVINWNAVAWIRKARERTEEE